MAQPGVYLGKSGERMVVRRYRANTAEIPFSLAAAVCSHEPARCRFGRGCSGQLSKIVDCMLLAVRAR